MRSASVVLLLGLSLACRSSAPSVTRYIVTATPIDVLGVAHPGLCVAVDPTDAQGVWWWEPGRSGCSSRSTGPTVFRAERATVTAPTQSGAIEVHFRLQRMVTGPRDVGLVLQGGGIRVIASGARVATERRSNLDVPPGV
jgi:hypothetical protein